MIGGFYAAARGFASRVCGADSTLGGADSAGSSSAEIADGLCGQPDRCKSSGAARSAARPMQRTPEPDLMDDAAQALAYAQAGFEAPHSRLLVLLRQRRPGLAAHGAALDLGCGPADISLRFARAFPGWTVDGLDGSAPMLALGRQAIEAAGLAARIRLVQAYLPDGAAPRAQYDLILSNSLLHHLRDPRVLWQSVRRWAAPGAAVFVVDLRRPASREAAQQLMEQYTAGEPAVLRHDFYCSLLAAYRCDEVREQLRAADLAHFAVDEISDRHLAVWGQV
jgi:SAM-dependent methyltransferase